MTAQAQTHGFQTEARQLLKLMIHSLYSNREVFLRELISNASDAIDKLRFRSIAEPGLVDAGEHFAITIRFDKDARTLTVEDNGIGMTRAESIEQLGHHCQVRYGGVSCPTHGRSAERRHTDRAIWRGVLQRVHRRRRG